MAGAGVGFTGLPELSNKIELLPTKHGGDVDVLTIFPGENRAISRNFDSEY
jgi:hypothetical protein